MSADGSDRQIISEAQPVPRVQAAWSGDGARLAFARQADPLEPLVGDLYLVEVDTGALMPVTSVGQAISGLDWLDE